MFTASEIVGVCVRARVRARFASNQNTKVYKTILPFLGNMKITIDRNVDAKIYTILSWYIANVSGFALIGGGGPRDLSDLYQLDKDKDGRVVFGLNANQHIRFVPCNNSMCKAVGFTDETYRYLYLCCPTLFNINKNNEIYEYEALFNGLDRPSCHEKRSLGELWFDSIIKEAHAKFEERFHF